VLVAESHIELSYHYTLYRYRQFWSECYLENVSTGFLSWISPWNCTNAFSYNLPRIA